MVQEMVKYGTVNFTVCVALCDSGCIEGCIPDSRGNPPPPQGAL